MAPEESRRRDVLTEEQRIGELNDRRALTDHLTDVGLGAELVDGEYSHLDTAVGRFILRLWARDSSRHSPHRP